MNFKFDDKDYDSNKLSDKGKVYFGKLQNLQTRQQQLTLENADINILQNHYSKLLKEELPKEEEVKEEEVKEVKEVKSNKK